MRFATAFAICAALAVASPVERSSNNNSNNNNNNNNNHGGNGNSNSNSSKGKTCIVKSLGGGDDTPAFHAAVKECGNSGVIEFSEGVDYTFLTPVAATGMKNAELKFLGNMHMPSNITYVQETVAATGAADWIYWFDFQGSDITITGNQNAKQGWFNGHGQEWYDVNAAAGCTGMTHRPHMFNLNFTRGSITNLKAVKPPCMFANIPGTDTTVKHTFFDASSSGGFPFNTDGFDIGGQLNGDDAVAIQAGAADITIRKAFIAGPGTHGMSIGSLGRDPAVTANVKNILFSDVTAVNALCGARFKSWIGGQGLVSDITWEDFHLHNVSFPICVTQNYGAQSLAQDSSTVASDNANSSVTVDGFTWRNWRGTVNTYNSGDGSCASDPCWYNAPGSDGTQVVVLTCANSTSCSNYKLEDIQVIPQSDAVPSVICSNVAPEANPEFGIVCQNGPFTSA